MKIFLDTASIDEIKNVHELGIVDGITTNPTLVFKAGLKYPEGIVEICKLIKGPVSVEVTREDPEGMICEGRSIARLSPNVAVKIPMTKNGLIATKILSSEGISVNVTLIFQPIQALLAARAGATYVSLFLGRLDDLTHDSMLILKDIMQIFNLYTYKTEVIAASIRHPLHVLQVARLGVQVVTMPYNVLMKLFDHPLTDNGIRRFLQDWNSMHL